MLTVNLSKNQLKAQAREHDRFRRMCVSVAQTLHQVDMRLRIGNIRETAAAQRRAEADAAVRKLKPTVPTAKTEAEAKAEQEAIARAQAMASEAAKPAPKPHIRPLSEAKAIESGAAFISETFLFLVAGGLIVFETMRARRKETTRREDMEGRLMELEQSEKAARKALVSLEKELLHLKTKHGESVKSNHILPREVWELEVAEEAEEAEEANDQGWLSRLQSYASRLSSVFRRAEQGTESAVEGVTDTKSFASKSSPHSIIPSGVDRNPPSAGQ